MHNAQCTMHNAQCIIRNEERGERNEEPTKWPGEMTKRVLPERQPAVAMPSALDPIALIHNT